jgi:hypothetical protein
MLELRNGASAPHGPHGSSHADLIQYQLRDSLSMGREESVVGHGQATARRVT